MRRLHGRYVCEETKGCTCGAGGGMYGHEPGCGLEPLFQLDRDATFVIVRPQIIGNAEQWNTAYYVDPERHPSIDAAVAHGIETYDHDDFLLAVLDGETVAAIAWQHELRDEPEELAAVAAQLCLPVSARAQEDAH